MKNQYKVGEEIFFSKVSIAKRAQDILKEKSGKVLDGGDLNFVMGLIYNHPRSKEKIGTGVKHIIVRPDPVWKKGNQFLIIRYDGSNIDFSYKKCIFGELSLLDQFRQACRTAVAQDIIVFKLSALSPGASCPYFKDVLTQDNSHVDHVKPITFNWLVDKFVNEYAINLDEVEIVGEIKKYFADDGLSVAFRKFHRIYGKLELVSERANQTVCKVNWKGDKNGN